MDKRQSHIEILFVTLAVAYFGFRISTADSIEKIEADVLRPIELAQSEGMRERAERLADEVLGPETSVPGDEGSSIRSLASIAEAATTVRLYATPLLRDSAHTLAADLDKHIYRRRAITPDEDLLRDKIAALKDEAKLAELSEDFRSLPLNLFTDADYVGVIDEVNPSLKGGYILRGHMLGERDSSLAMVYENGTLIADMAVGRDRYELRYMQDTHVVQQIDSSRMDSLTTLSEGQLLNEITSQLGGVAGPVHVNITYSSPVKITQGSRASVEGSVQLAAARANELLAKSGSSAQVQIVSLNEGNVALGGFQIASADASAKAKPEACGLEFIQDENTVWTSGEMVEIRWHSSDVEGPLEMFLIFPDGSLQSLGTTENDGQTHILVPKGTDTDSYHLRLQSSEGCVVESRSIQIR